MNEQEVQKKNSEGLAAFQAGKYEEAIQLFSDAINLNPNYTATWLNRSEAYRKLGRITEADADKNKWLILKRGEEEPIIVSETGRVSISREEKPITDRKSGNKIERSWQLCLESIRVLRKEPRLIMFPAVSFGAMVVIGGAIWASFGLIFGESAFYILIIPFYFVFYGVVIYSQVALVSSVKLRLEGGNPTLKYGVTEANKRLGAILSWTLIASTVGILLNLLLGWVREIKGVGGILAEILVKVVGEAWNLGVFFVVPVIAYEGIGGFKALKRSAGIIKQRWGEAVVGAFGFGLIACLGALVPFILMISGLVFSLAFNLGVGITLFVVGVLGMVFVFIAWTALESIFRATLYQYAITGRAGDYFSSDTLDGAFKSKN